WDAIAQKLRRKVKTCRGWPSRYPNQWETVYRAAQHKRFEQTSEECHSHLIGLMRDDDPKVKEKGCALWMRFGAKAYGLTGEMGSPRPAKPESKSQHILDEIRDDMDPVRDRMDKERERKGLRPATDKEFRPYYQADLERRFDLSGKRKAQAGQ